MLRDGPLSEPSATLEGCGLLALIKRVLGVDAVSTFKPHPDVYAYALSELRRTPTGSRFSRPIHGISPARHTVACARPGCAADPAAWPSVFPIPDVQADTITDLATAILAHRW
jgi:hypothetical protein